MKNPVPVPRRGASPRRPRSNGSVGPPRRPPSSTSRRARRARAVASMLTTAGFSRAAMSAKLIDVGDGDGAMDDSAAGGGLLTVDAAASESGDDDTRSVLGIDSNRPISTPMTAASDAVVTTYRRVMTRHQL